MKYKVGDVLKHNEYGYTMKITSVGVTKYGLSLLRDYLGFKPGYKRWASFSAVERKFTILKEQGTHFPVWW